MTVLFKEGFETGKWSHACRVFPVGGEPYNTEIGNIFSPEDWVCYFKHQPGTWDQPEAHNTWAHVDLHRIHSGEGAYMLFTFYRKHDAGLMRQVAVTPGSTLTLTAWAHAWSNADLEGHHDCYNDGRCSCGVGKQVIALEEAPPLNGDPWNDSIGNFTFMVGIDPTGGIDPYASTVVWGKSYHIYNGYAQRLTVEATAQSNKATVFIRSKTLWGFRHNDAYWDDVILEEAGSEDCWGKPRVQYDRTYVLIPQGYKSEWAEAAVRGGYDKRYTVGYSADDAGIGMLDAKQVIAVNPSTYPDDLEGFYKQYYPKAKYVPMEAATPEILEQKLKGEPVPDNVLLWQCDPRWVGSYFSDGCDICNLGCWVCCLWDGAEILWY